MRRKKGRYVNACFAVEDIVKKFVMKAFPVVTG